MLNTGLTSAGYGWGALSLIAALTSCAGYYLPVWLVGNISHQDQRLETYFGCFRRCNYPIVNHITHEISLAEVCGRYKAFKDIPSIWWQISTVFAGLGCGFALLIAFIIIPAFCINDIISRTSARALGIGQAISGALIIVGCVLYPIGWSSKEVNEICGKNSGTYLLGSCTIGWGLYLVLGGATLLFICASLSIFSGKPIDWPQTNADDSLLKTANV